jgi:Ca2+-transporting ATPase
MQLGKPHPEPKPARTFDANGNGVKPAVMMLHGAVQGRARFRIAALYRAETLKIALEQSLGTEPGIHTVRANPLIGSLLIHFEPQRSVAEITTLLQQHLAAALKQHPMPPADRDHHASVDNKVTSIFQHPRARANIKAIPTTHSTPPPPASNDANAWHALTAASIVNALASTTATGLTLQDAEARLRRHGPNALSQAKARSELSIFVEQFKSWPVGLLAGSAVISLMTGGLLDAAVIMGVVLINAAIGFVTERQAERTISALTKMTPRSAWVLRDGTSREIAVEDVTLGDIVLLSPGSYVPADLRLLHTSRLSIDESTLTGESMPVTKSADFLGLHDTPLGDRHNMAYMGTMVTGGSGVGIVVAIAKQSELGQIQALVGEAQTPETPMQRQLGTLGTQLALLSGAICGGVFVIGLLRGNSWLQMLKASISLAVAAVPEGLPAVATTTLALGIKEMRKQKVAIRHIDAVETLGAVQVFCLDKTGTLTLNRMSVVAACSGGLRLVVSEGHFFAEGVAIDPRGRDELMRLLHVVSLCSEAENNGEAGATSLNGSATENALLEIALNAGVDVARLRRRYPRQKTHYRAEGRPYMSTVHMRADGGYLLAVKGSPPEVLAMCRWAMRDGAIQELDETSRDRILAENEAMAGNALRVLGVAYAHGDEGPEPALDDLVWLGLMGMADPLRTGMPQLIGLFHQAGIRTVMITGDQSTTAYAIGKQLNLSNGAPLQILDSNALDKLDPQLLAGLVHKVHVFARVSPAHKLQIVQALQRAGNVVAMTGDGINDGPALKAADIGVAMGDSGTDVARSVADVVLQDDNLHTMVNAVREGRTIYVDIRKAIHFLVSTNLTEIEVMLAGVLLGRGQTLNPMQLLWINLVTDIFPGLALSLEPPEADILSRPPRDPQEPIIRSRDLRRMLAESAVITSGSLASYAYGLLRYGPGAPQASTLTFNTVTIAQLLHALSCRSEHHSIFSKGKRAANPYLSLALGGTFALQLLAMLVPGLRQFLGAAPLGLVDAMVVGAGASLPLLINETTKEMALSHGDRQADTETIATKPRALPQPQGGL